MFYLLKNLLLLIMVIFKIKYNNLIFNKIMILNISYVCLHIIRLKSWKTPLISEGFCHTFRIILHEDDPDDGASQPEDDVYFHRLALDEARTAADVELMFKKASPTGMAGAVVPTHCDGLVALATANGRACVCNPATREFVALPPGARGSKGAAALCYDRWRDRYVVVRCFYRRYDEYQDAASGKRKLDYEIGHEVFTLGDSSWEPTADPPLAIGPADPVCTRDAVYWCTDDDDTLLRFSLRYRAFDVASGPPSAGSCCGNRTVTGLGGKLCYVACNRWSEGGYDVWVADADATWASTCSADRASGRTPCSRCSPPPRRTR
jgi:F-box interacting protein